MVIKLYKRLRFAVMLLGFLTAYALVICGFRTRTCGVETNAVSTLHPIFVSVTEMNHNPKDRTLEISCKIFTDDFETVLTKATGSKIDLMSPKDTALTGKQISDYIGKHLLITIDGKPAKLNLIGFERELDAVWSYFEISQVVTPPRNISVMNDLLYDNFKEQINLMHVTVGGKRKSTKLDNPDSNAAFSF
jgi:hypothetical protein